MSFHCRDSTLALLGRHRFQTDDTIALFTPVLRAAVVSAGGGVSLPKRLPALAAPGAGSGGKSGGGAAGGVPGV
jgi:hypothetical protein